MQFKQVYITILCQVQKLKYKFFKSRFLHLNLLENNYLLTKSNFLAFLAIIVR